MTTTCIKSVCGGKHGHVPYEILLLQQSLFLVSVKCNGDHRTYKDDVKSGHPQFWGYYRM